LRTNNPHAARRSPRGNLQFRPLLLPQINLSLVDSLFPVAYKNQNKTEQNSIYANQHSLTLFSKDEWGGQLGWCAEIKEQLNTFA
jgi:hypothetical protein